MNWLKTAGGWASGLNWYKWGAIAVVLASLCGGSYLAGKHSAELTCEEEKTKAAENKAEKIVEYVTVRVPEIQYKDRVSVVYRDRVVKIGEKLDEAIKAKPDNPACDLSDDEYRMFNDIVQGSSP